VSASRTEYKFVISTDQRDQLGEEIGMRLGADSAGIGGNYPIVSQYYDSPNRDCYWEKVRRLKSRRKIRIRMYGSDRAAIPPAAFVEIKHKLFGAGGKRRLPVSVDVASGFVAGDQELLRNMLPEVGRSGRMIIAEIFDLVERYGHVPSMQIRYDRSAFTTEDGKFRVTFDSDLMCRAGKYPLRADDPTFVDQVLDPSQVMMEVKSVGSVPYWFRGWIAEAGLVRESFSKYCTSLERHDPVLRSMLRARA
jgi:hypothetical protein